MWVIAGQYKNKHPHYMESASPGVIAVGLGTLELVPFLYCSYYY